MKDILIDIYHEKYKNEIIEFICNIQANEFGISITIKDQPDLQNIKQFYQKGKGNFWVVIVDNHVVGTVALIDIGNSQVALRKMFVAKEFRGLESGIAKKLLNTCIAWCQKHHINEIFLGTTDVFLAAHRFYEKSGFQVITKNDLPENFPIMKIDTKFYVLKIIMK
jgi:N-acetylglutamate synthase-like GNAT family acetyltransferase